MPIRKEVVGICSLLLRENKVPLHNMSTCRVAMERMTGGKLGSENSTRLWRPSKGIAEDSCTPIFPHR